MCIGSACPAGNDDCQLDGSECIADECQCAADRIDSDNDGTATDGGSCDAILGKSNHLNTKP